MLMTKECASGSTERGQVLIVFLAVFSVFLILGAFALDQGLWLDGHRTSQKDADAAARAGASVYLQSLSAGSTPSAVTYTNAKARAAQYENANGNSASGAITTSANCPQAYGGTVTGAPSVSVVAQRTQGSLFGRIFGTNSVNVSAGSTACVGSATAIAVTMKNGIPIEVFSDDNVAAQNNCFDGTSFRLGMQCIIKYGAGGKNNGKRGFFRKPDNPSQCTGNGNGNIKSYLTGVDFTCQIDTSGCPGPACIVAPCTDVTCVNPKPGDITSTLDAWQARITGDQTFANPGPPLTCVSDSFQDTFDYGSGAPGPVKGPPGLNSPPNSTAGNVDPATTVYINKACENPRSALVVLTDSSGNPVLGFAEIYIVGCFDENVPALTNALNDCSSGFRFGGHTEVRAVIVSIIMTGGSVGGITPPTGTSPLVIQTTK